MSHQETPKNPGLGKGLGSIKGHEKGQDAAISALKDGQVADEERDRLLAGLVESVIDDVRTLAAAVFPDEAPPGGDDGTVV